ncbi:MULTISPECIES: hypothetical protein [Paenibacillus]|uniref:Uncharacterized protein n=1 Tax=Paenibacillus naphthalenovorans TaxID=162209 RepID=A0A0U2UNF7_9BACL|nr:MULTISPECIES: hypothetical protein [Paenibacillus]ALS24604.1 hypothetical protein IJ22_43180 [Paenibacillus naphthalenovorans]GCL74655.1 hypothetical protein PN4B1_46250 [Paenibacillus naphthalenovorans]SDJ40643.1 hypothetical protein SAMN05421868_12635 [Paenibacillus naphthalenovorans]
MENIIAAFRNPHDMEKAAEALLKQGVINLKLEPGALHPKGEQPDITLLGRIGTSISETAAKLQVIVESSRRRQAEDTIRKYGGVCWF